MKRQYTPSEVHVELLRTSDVPQLFALIEANRSALRSWMSWVDRTLSAADVQKFVARAWEGFVAGVSVECGVWRHGTLVGVVGLEQFDRTVDVAVLGYWLGKRFRRKGLMRAACSVVVVCGMRHLRLRRIEAHCAASNGRGARVVEALGFQLEGTLRRRIRVGRRIDDLLIYGLLAEEWRIEVPEATYRTLSDQLAGFGRRRTDTK